MISQSKIKCLCLAGLILAVCLLAGCSGIRPYPNDLSKNLNVQTEAESGSVFSKVRASVDIYKVDGSCQVEYQGTVKLSEPLIKVGIPTDRLSYMVFYFTSTGFLASSRSSINQGALLKPRSGYKYDVQVSYMDDIYDVKIRETHPRKSKSREIELKDLSDCGSL